MFKSILTKLTALCIVTAALVIFPSATSDRNIVKKKNNVIRIGFIPLTDASPIIMIASVMITIFARLLIGWAVSLVGGIAGLFFSYWWDLPSGAAIVCTLGALLVLTSLTSLFRPHHAA